MHDIIVVGGGAAGMTAALYAQRNGKSALVIEKNGFGGQITHSPKVENYPGTLQMSGNEFAEKMLDQILAQGAEIEFENVISVEDRDQILAQGAEIEFENVISVEDRGDVKIVRTEEGGVYEGSAVVLATGVKHRMLGIEGEEELVGDGISFCAVCDGDFYTGRRVCVAGGGNSALQEAILLSEKCSEVIMLQDLDFFTGEQKLQEVLFAKPNVKSFTGVKIGRFLQKDGELCGLEVERTKTGETFTVECEGLFVAIGLIPENDPFRELADLNGFGYFDSDERCETKTPGIYVAGDCRSKNVRQLTTAVADGASAALAACRYLQMR